MKTTHLYFEVLSGEALALVNRHVADRGRVERENREICTKYGAEKYFVSPLDGAIIALEWNVAHPDFTKPNSKGYSRPKRGTKAADDFASVKGYDAMCRDIEKALGIVTGIEYEGNGTIKGSALIGYSFKRTHVLYPAKEGPYCIVFADPRPTIADHEARGYTVLTKFKPELPGCRLITQEEWELALAQYAVGQAAGTNGATIQPSRRVVEELYAERRRQVTEEGFGPAFDDGWTEHQLERAAASFALFSTGRFRDTSVGLLWPFSQHWLKAKTPRGALVKAGALIVAAIERLDRLEGR